MNKTVRNGLLVAALLAPPAARAGMIVAQETWSNPPSVENWWSDEAWVALSNPSGYLNISLAATATNPGDPGAEWYALAKTDASSFFAGNWQGLQVAFDFWADDVVPGYVQVRWSSATNAAVWRATVYDSSGGGGGGLAVGQWTTLTAPALANYLDWNYGSGSQQEFISDLATIDWIGVYIWRNTGLAQDYGIDNFRLMVPEPQEYMLLAAAALSTALSLRRRKPAAAAGDGAAGG